MARDLTNDGNLFVFRSEGIFGNHRRIGTLMSNVNTSPEEDLGDAALI